MNVADKLKSAKNTLFSFEILPPIKGKGIDSIYKTLDPLMEFNPQFINITSHREQYDENNKRTRKRPGTVALAAAIKYKYHVEVVPHILCGGFSRSETEYVLIDLNFLEISNIMCLRGDPLKKEGFYKPEPDGNTYASDLVKQVQDMNKGKYLDDDAFGMSIQTNFTCGVAGYPEKHHLATNMELDLKHLKEKVDAGADYIITQLFFDNQKFYDFEKACRNIGITVPIIPGIKPIGMMNQVDVLPELFFIDMPKDLADAIRKCKDDEEAKIVGNEWSVMQAKDLIKNGAKIVHFYTYGSAKQTLDICRQVF